MAGLSRTACKSCGEGGALAIRTAASSTAAFGPTSFGSGTAQAVSADGRSNLIRPPAGEREDRRRTVGGDVLFEQLEALGARQRTGRHAEPRRRREDDRRLVGGEQRFAARLA